MQKSLKIKCCCNITAELTKIHHVTNYYWEENVRTQLNLTTRSEFARVDSKRVSTTVLLLHDDIITRVSAVTVQVKWCAVVAHCYTHTTTVMSPQLAISLNHRHTLTLAPYYSLYITLLHNAITQIITGQCDSTNQSVNPWKGRDVKWLHLAIQL